jgi:hypothetical protein
VWVLAAVVAAGSSAGVTMLIDRGGDGGLADQLGRGWSAAARDLKQRCGQVVDESGHAAVQLAGANVQLAGALEQFAREFGDEPVRTVDLNFRPASASDGDPQRRGRCRTSRL